jgi:hypothetical protein
VRPGSEALPQTNWPVGAGHQEVKMMYIVVVKLPSGRITEFKFDTEEDAKTFRSDVIQTGSTAVVVGEK